MLLLTSVTWMHLAGSGLPRLAPFRKLKRCSLCGPGSPGVPEADRMPSMQYGSLKPGTQQVPQSLITGPPTLHSNQVWEQLAHPGQPSLTIGVFGQQVLGTHDGHFQGICGGLWAERC